MRSKKSPFGPHPAALPEDLRSVMGAWARQQAALSAEVARFFVDLDLTMAQMRALGQIRRWGRMTGRDLAGRLGVTPGTVVPLIDRLEELDYVRRVTDPRDRRPTWLELTPTGERLFHRLFEAGGEKVMKAIAQFSPSDRKILGRLLNQIAEYMESLSERLPEEEQTISTAEDDDAPVLPRRADRHREPVADAARRSSRGRARLPGHADPR